MKNAFCKRLFNGVLVLGLAVPMTACGGSKTEEASDITAEISDTEETAAEASTKEQAEEASESEDASIEDDETPAESGNTSYITDSVLSTDLIQLTVPTELEGTTYAEVTDEMISIYDKELVDEGFPGFVFAVVTSSDNDVYGGGMFTKEGEVYAADATVYNVSKGLASEVQWDYNEPDMPESYAKLLDAADSMIENITGVGDNYFVYKAGTEGEGLYYSVLDKYISAISEGKDAAAFEEDDMSPEIASIAANTEDPFENIGYAYADVNSDGIDELFIGDMTGGELDGAIYDIYTTVNREPAHVVSGSARDRYYVYNDYAVINEYSGGAGEYGSTIYIIEPNSTELSWQVGYKYDSYENEEKPWFTGYSDREWEPMEEDLYNDSIDGLESGKIQLTYTPLSSITGVDFSNKDLSKYSTFTEIVDDLNPGMAYANVTIGDTDALFVANGCYDDLEGHIAAIDSSIFVYDENGSIVYVGYVSSQGTADPLAVNDGILYITSHHAVTKYTIENNELVEIESAYEDFDDDGDAAYFYGTDKDGFNEVDDDSKLQQLFDEGYSGDVIDFQEVS